MSKPPPPVRPAAPTPAHPPPAHPPRPPLETETAPDEGAKKPVDLGDAAPLHDKLRVLLHIFSSICCIALFMIGIYGFAGEAPMKLVYVVSFWLVVLSPVLMAAEWRVSRVRQLFKFLAFRTGRGFMFEFLGSLACGVGGYFGIGAGGMCIVCGWCMFGFAALARKFKASATAPEPDFALEP